jgi:hypothetical protein
VTVVGILLALPLTFVLAQIARPLNVEVLLPIWLVVGVGGIILAVGLLSPTAARSSPWTGTCGT